MLSLNLASSFFFSSLVELTLGVGMLTLWARGRMNYLALWSSGFFACGVGHLLIMSRDRIPDFLSILGGNLGLTLSSVLFYAGICACLGLRRSRLPWLILGLEIALLAAYSYITYDTSVRVYVYSVAQALIALVNLAALFAAARVPGRSRNLDAVAALLFFVAIMVVRMAGTWVMPTPRDFLASGTFQIVFAFGLTLAHIGYALAFGNMHASTLRERLNERSMELEAANRQLETLSVTDPLTGLYNRRHFNDVLQSTLGGARQSGSGVVAVSIFDIDHFKQYNDHYGHPQGDVALRRISEMLRDAMGYASDFVFRLGGEEFCVIFSASDADMAWRTVETLRQKIEALAIPHPAGPGSVVTASFGLTCARADSGLDQHALYMLADGALYEAKAAGRNRVVSSLVPV